MKRLSVGIVFLSALLGACAPSGGCESRCMDDDACMRALEADGIAPYGETRGDRGLCNGICSALRTSERSAKRRWKELGPLPVHACLRAAD